MEATDDNAGGWKVWSADGVDIWVTPGDWDAERAWRWLLEHMGYGEDDVPLDDVRPATSDELAVRVTPEEPDPFRPAQPSDPTVADLATGAKPPEFLCTTEW